MTLRNAVKPFQTLVGRHTVEPDQDSLMENFVQTAQARKEESSGLVIVDKCPFCEESHSHRRHEINQNMALCRNNGGAYQLEFDA